MNFKTLSIIALVVLALGIAVYVVTPPPATPPEQASPASTEDEAKPDSKQSDNEKKGGSISQAPKGGDEAKVGTGEDELPKRVWKKLKDQQADLNTEDEWKKAIVRELETLQKEGELSEKANLQRVSEYILTWLEEHDRVDTTS